MVPGTEECFGVDPSPIHTSFLSRGYGLGYKSVGEGVRRVDLELVHRSPLVDAEAVVDEGRRVELLDGLTYDSGDTDLAGRLAGMGRGRRTGRTGGAITRRWCCRMRGWCWERTTRCFRSGREGMWWGGSWDGRQIVQGGGEEYDGDAGGWRR
jgi:hypothetical protein